MINEKFVVYGLKTKCQSDIASGELTLNSIAFVEDEKEIWAQGMFYSGAEAIQVVNNTTSTLTTAALSAAQGKVLNDTKAALTEVIAQITSHNTASVAHTDIRTAINTKVDKVVGKALSTEDYTTAEKTKLNSIEDRAQVNKVVSVAGRIGAVTLTKNDVGLTNVDNTSDALKAVSSATKLTAAKTITLTGAVTGNVSTDMSTNPTISTTLTGFDAAKITSGVVSIDRLPKSAIERLIVVANDAVRFALTTELIQLGDTVKVTETNKMYFVTNETKINTEEGYEPYTATEASSVAWSGVTSKPTTVSGYGITDAIVDSDARLTNSRPASDVSTWAKKTTKPTYTAAEVSALAVDGTAVAATKLQTARTISGIAFDGTANITLTKSNVGLSNVDNTTDLGKPVSTATQTALTDKITTHDTSSSSHADLRTLINTYTALDVLAKLKTVDGVGSGLDADLLDGLNSDAFPKVIRLDATIDLNTVNGYGIATNPDIANVTPENNYPILEAGTLFYGTAINGSANQIYGSYQGNRWFARGGGKDSEKKTPWKEFAFTDSNVASATKLDTRRTLWGQSFDGTWNVNGMWASNGNVNSVVANCIINNGAIELYENMPTINFHAGNNTNTTSNIQEVTQGQLSINGIKFSASGAVPSMNGMSLGSGSNPWLDIYARDTITANYFDGKAKVAEKLEFFEGSNSVITLTNLPITKCTINATLSSTSALSMDVALPEGHELLIRCVPTASFVQPIPNTGTWTSMSGVSYTTTANKPFEISIWCYKAGYYSIVVKEQD